MSLDAVRVGTAGWSIPKAVADQFPSGGSALERYAARLPAVEINSSFHRPHRPSTYSRWAATAPPGFRFAVKLPKTITHISRLIDSEPLLSRFTEEIAGLGAARGPLLVQLPPSLAFDDAVAGSFFALLDNILAGPAVCEPRHASWFTPDADSFLAERRIARVAADPTAHDRGGTPGGWTGLAYWRLHGSPRTYWSAYDSDALKRLAREVAEVRTRGCDCWVMFDNTASGAAAADALRFMDCIEKEE